MKFLFAFFVLLPLCNSMRIGMNLSKEIKSALTKLQENKVPPPSVDVPSREMQNNALYCEGVFIKHLYQLLEKVKGHSSSKNIEGLMEILQKMKFPGEDGINVHRCRMTKSSMPFKQYSYFLMKLNSMRPITSTPRT
ncbi:hypothetical protein EXN66_Car009386 [Channa argus]|uniref:Interleukin-4 n=1 Tax=Channa argus TaxID=215402 RepID=A0A6G1PTS9_CHAAH|nr:hypothetical protein EXN66_Car009386 [Channa argus]